ncbi:LPS export ABC transporter periplasmic protein LptC [Bergeriella denitrificans]|uniref:Lipopolysaccharide exporter periplasmic protein n=1 Tax=Bergeriella denitrificans TaxID=494 RepID=A0A378UI53_BERDE|nr:LPS export ABC transporter periplasmic protein LptC [Bergeriella denitrificans]STZ76997.1 lipopolysaccharide exporter periplasmic protein [Bergeriella denitrificans]
MKIRWRYGIAFPLILAVALGGLSAWLGRISEIQTEEVKLNPHEPQYAMQGIDGRHFDDAGRLKEHLTADTAWQLPESKEVHFDTPQLLVYQEGSLLYQVDSRRAAYHTDDKTIQFDGQVVMTKSADSDRPAGIVRTDTLHVDTETRHARTDAPVNFEYGRSSGSSVGMTYDHEKGLLTLPSRVKATIYDVKTL